MAGMIGELPEGVEAEERRIEVRKKLIVWYWSYNDPTVKRRADETSELDPHTSLPHPLSYQYHGEVV